MQQWVVEGPEKRLDVFLARMLEGEVNRTRVGNGWNRGWYGSTAIPHARKA